MIRLKIKIEDQEVRQALGRLAAQGKSLRPAMRDIGEYLVESVKHRFAEGKGPDGTPWENNTEATMLAYLYRRGGATMRRREEKGKERGSNPYFNKKGQLNSRGSKMVTGKRPLIGESRRMSPPARGRGVAPGSGLTFGHRRISTPFSV